MLEYLRLMMMTPEDTRGKPIEEFDFSRTISEANEAQVLQSVVLSYNQRMAVRHRRNEKRLLKRTLAALEKQIRNKGLDTEELARAEGSTLGKVLKGEKRKEKSALEDKLEKLGLPIDLR